MCRVLGEGFKHVKVFVVLVEAIGIYGLVLAACRCAER